jgi:hypothetical protein
VGQRLSDLTSQRVIVLILAMLVVIPGFNWNSGLYGGYNDVAEGGLQMLHDTFLAEGNSSAFQSVRTPLRLFHLLLKSPHRKWVLLV